MEHSSKKALLIYPKFPVTFWSYKYALKFIAKKAALPPLGLLTIAAMLPSDWDKRVIDLNTRNLSEKELASADIVFISAMIAQKNSTESIIQRCKKANKTIIAGGPLFFSEHTSFPDVDHFVLSEAEETLSPFLSDFHAGKAHRIYRSQKFPSMKKTPVPMWNLVNLNHYASLSIQYSRGCPFNCEFCSVTALFGHRVRTKQVDQILTELDTMWNLGWRGPVFFVDDNFIGNKRILKEELLPAMIRWRKQGRHYRLYTEASINLADDDKLMEMMVSSGFDQVFVGIETPDETSLIECNKTQNRHRSLLSDIKKIQNAGLQVQGGFIVGFDSDPVSIFKRQAEFIQHSGIVTTMVGLLQAIPGTRLYHRLASQGRLIGASTGDNVDGSTNFKPMMDENHLQIGYYKLMHYLYAPKQYYQRIRVFLINFHPKPSPLEFSWRNVHAFVSASIRLGILGRERFHYWWLLVWTLTRCPRQISNAITLSIFGFHFRKCCNQMKLPKVKTTTSAW